MKDVWKVLGEVLDMVWYDIQEAELVEFQQEVQDSWQEVQEDHHGEAVGRGQGVQEVHHVGDL